MCVCIFYFFSFRYGPPLPGGSIDNCQLSDWPYAELDPRKDLVPEPGYEVYERGSYGHGCEQDHFTIPGHHGIGDHGVAVPKPSDKSKIQQSYLNNITECACEFQYVTLATLNLHVCRLKQRKVLSQLQLSWIAKQNALELARKQNFLACRSVTGKY